MNLAGIQFWVVWQLKRNGIYAETVFARRADAVKHAVFLHGLAETSSAGIEAREKTTASRLFERRPAVVFEPGSPSSPPGDGLMGLE